MTPISVLSLNSSPSLTHLYIGLFSQISFEVKFEKMKKSPIFLGHVIFVNEERSGSFDSCQQTYSKRFNKRSLIPIF